MAWEAIIALLGVGSVWLVMWLKERKKNAADYELEDARLKGKQQAKEEELDSLEAKIARVEEKLGRMKKPEDIENHWNKKK